MRTTSRVSDEHNRRLDGLPRRQADGQSQPKQGKTEEVHLAEITEEEILQAVVESRLGRDEKKAFAEAKRKALVPGAEMTHGDQSLGQSATRERLSQCDSC